MAEIKTGCISWTYPGWTGNFYPTGSRSSDLLSIYSRVFDIVEVDSTFYRLPTSSTVKQWREKTPDNFLFTVKMPKRITHEMKLKGIEKELGYFEKTLELLGDKLGAVMAQLPPAMKYTEENFGALSDLLDKFPEKTKVAIEFRNKSWFREETYGLLKSKGACFVWSVNEYVEGMPKEVTSDFVYLRFMGEFGKLEKLDRVQIDRTDLMSSWWDNLSGVLAKIERSYVLFSNHFAGFAPESVNQFRKIAGLEMIEWK